MLNKTTHWTCILVALTCSLAIVFPDYFFIHAGHGLDPSWRLSLHMAWNQGLIWGKEFVFTYGPLGFLCARLPFPELRYFYLVSDLFVFGNLLFLLWTALDTEKTAVNKMAVPLIVFCLGWGVFFIDLPLMLLAIQLFHIGRYINFGSRTSLVISCVVAGLQFYIKLNAGLIAIVLELSGIVVVGILNKQVLTTITTTAIFLAAIASVSFVLPVSIIPYIINSLQIVAGYNDAMGVTIEGRQHYLLASSFVLFFWVMYGLSVIKPLFHNMRDLAIWGATSLCLFILFKQGFVRADGHEDAFFNFAPFVLGIASISLSDLHRRAIRTLVVVALFGSFAVMFKHFTPDYFAGQLEGVPQYGKQLIASDDTWRSALQPPVEDVLQPEILSLLKDKTVDIFPWDISVIYYNKLKYIPRPVMQSYSVYTSALDQLNAAELRSSRSADFLLARIECVDGRYCLSEEGETHRAIVEKYRPVTKTSNGYLVLTKREEPLTLTATLLKQRHVTFQKKVTVPASDGLVYLFGSAHYSLYGTLRSIFFKPAELRMSFHLENGELRDYRLVRGMLEGGFPVNRLVENLDHYEKFSQGHWRDLPRINQISFWSPTPEGFKDGVDVRFVDYTSNQLLALQ